jgi:hypothetical protein
MPWDPNRPIPWRRLYREAAIFLVLGALIFAFVIKKSTAGSYFGLLVGAFLFVGFSALLTKFGYDRQTLRKRAELQPRRRKGASPAATSTAVRARPAPTKRTTTGPSQRPKSKRR